MPFVTTIPLAEKGFTKSNYKLYCHVCDGTIHRGDEIARCEEYYGWISMTLRARLTADRKSFYTPDTGARWVHKNCDPGFWTTYSVIAETEKANKKMNEERKYICSNLGIKDDQSMGIGGIITKAYKVLGESILVGLTIGEELGHIKYLIDKRNND